MIQQAMITAGRTWQRGRAGLVAGAVGLALLLAACDMGGSNPAPAGPTPSPTAASPVARGADVYARYCQVCHPGGQRGVGDRLIGTPLNDDRIKLVVRQGKRNMPAYTAQDISDPDLQNLVDYIRSLK